MSSADLTLLSKWIDQRDAQAFKELASKHGPKVYATCCRILRDASDAEEAAQDCFIKLAGTRSAPTGSLGAWLHKVATNQALDRIRKEKRRLRREAAYVAACPAHTETAWDDVSGFVDEAIAALPDAQRIPIVEFFMNDRSHAEIAEELGASRQTVTYRIGKGVDAIRKTLRKKGIVITATAFSALLHKNIAHAAPLPSSLAGSLGRLALAGPPASVGAATAAIGFFTAWKITAIAAAVLAVAVGAPIAYTYLAPAPGGVSASTPPPVSQSVQSSGSEDTAGSARQAHSADVNNGDPSVPPQGAPSITGRVYDLKTGKGISGLGITASSRSNDAIVNVSATTAADGRFTFAGLQAGLYTLQRDFAEGLPNPQESDVKTVTVRPDGPVEVDLPVDKGLSVTGVVLNAEGQSVGDAFIDAWKGSGIQNAHTDETGAFRLLGFAKGDQITVRAIKDFGKEQELRSYIYGPFDVRDSGLHGLEIVVQEMSAISGKIIDPAGKPLEDAPVRAALEQFRVAPPGPQIQMENGQVAVSTEGGLFRLGSLFAGTWQVGFSEMGTQQVVTTAPGEQVSGLTLVYTGEPLPQLQTGTLTISGRVTAPDGQPVKDAHIAANAASDEGQDCRADAKADENGLFTVRGLIEGAYRLHAVHGAFGHVFLSGIPAGSQNIDLQFPGLGQVEGRVARADTGEPLTDFTVGHISEKGAEPAKTDSPFVLSLLGLGLAGSQNVHDPDGHFAIQGVPPGDCYVVVQAEGFAPEYARVTVAASGHGSAPVLVQLKPEARVDGVVLTERSEPVAGASIFWRKSITSREQAGQLRVLAVARSDSKGQFTVGGLPQGPVTITAYHPDYALGAAETVVAAGKSTSVTLKLAGGGRLEGTVRHAGKPVPHLELVVMYPRGRYESAVTSAQGTYALSGIAPGEAKVEARLSALDKLSGKAHRNVSKSVIIENGKTTVADIDFAPADAALEGRISVEGLLPASAKVSLSVRTATGDQESYYSGPVEGEYRFDELPAGLAKLTATASTPEGKRTAHYELTLKAGQALRFDIDFSGGSVLEGTVSGLAPNERCAVCLYSNDKVSPEKLARILSTFDGVEGPAHATGAVAEDGTFQLKGLAPGNYTAVAFAFDPAAPDRRSQAASIHYAVAPVTVTGQQPVTLHLDLQRGVRE